MSFRSGVLGLLTAALAGALVAPAAQADFGLVPGHTSIAALNKDGTLDTRAGGHPYSFQVHFDLKTDEQGITEGGEMRDVLVDLPPGLLGNPHAVPACSPQQFEGQAPDCPPGTQVGILRANVRTIGEVFGPIYNIAPPPGVAAELGFDSVGLLSLQSASVRSDEGYAIGISAPDLPLEVTSVTETIWGTPADPGHTPERGREASGGVPSEAPLLPFLTMPTSCQSPPEMTVKVDSKLNPGVFVGETVPMLDNSKSPLSLTGCEAVPFSPQISSMPTNGSSDSPSGLNFELTLPDQGLLNPSGTAESEPVKTEVVLPAGVTVNPSSANGIGVCTPAQYQAANATSGPGQGCPEASKLGTLIAKTPVLEEAIEGSVYLAAPHDNPFNSLIALYIVAKAPERGILVKQAGDVSADPVTGQLTTTFDGLPPLPYSSFEFDLRGGPRAPLTTPQACGTYTTFARLYPFSDPATPIERSASFTVSSAPNGAACASGEPQMPNAPTLQAGTATPLAGVFSPLVFKLQREDGSQRLSSIATVLPEGLLGRIAGVSRCSEAQIAAAAARSNEGEGALERSAPSCPEGSQVGVVNITAGAGSAPYPVQGKVYFAGPYKGAPFSLAIITPAIAGPFDLGTVVVRVALYVDPTTAQIRAVSDPIPSILDGIPLDLRSVALNLSRAAFTFNPTSCEPMTLSGQATSLAGQTVSLSNRFQVGGCNGLAFNPTFAASTAGNGNFHGTSLDVKISQKPGEAAIRKVDTQLPITLSSRLATLQKACTEKQFAANPAGCPAGSLVGSATAVTPILNVPLTGPAYLVSHGGAAFPDLDILLQGEGVAIDLVGNTDIKKGITYSRFETVPDAPITSFELKLPSGPGALLAAIKNPCAPTKTVTVSRKITKQVNGHRKRVRVKVKQTVAEPLLMPVTLTGQNGAVVKRTTKIAVAGCPKVTAKKAKKTKKARKRRH